MKDVSSRPEGAPVPPGRLKFDEVRPHSCQAGTTMQCSANRLHTLRELLPVPVLEADTALTLAWLCPAWKSQTGVDAARLAAVGWRGVAHADDPGAVVAWTGCATAGADAAL